MPDDPSSQPIPSRFDRRIAVAICLLFGATRAWIGRFSLDSDGISYLDLSDAFNRHDWRGFLSAYWSPLYPFLLALSRRVLPTSKRWELPSAHILNFFIYAITLACFEIFYAQLRNSLPANATDDGEFTLIGERPLWILSHALFLWTSLDLITIWGIGADMLVAAFVYIIAALILRFGRDANWKTAALLGAVLGASYWAKAVMFPLAFAFLLIAILQVRNVRTVVTRGVVMLAAFALFAGPLVATLSLQKHRLTFGDSGRINYAVFVSPGGVMRNWQGEPAWGIAAVHPTRKLLDDPPLYEFAEPVGGTFPPFYDPSYWQEGRVPVFRLRAQIKTAIPHLLFYADLLLHRENAVLAAFLTFLFLARASVTRSYRRTWPLLLLSASGFGLYMLVHAEARFLGSQIAILWLALLAPLRVPNDFRRMSNALLWAVSAILLVAVADNTARAVREGGPYSAMPDIQLSERLDSIGIHAGDRIGVIGDVSIYAVRLSHAKVVAEIMSADTPAFWRLPAEKKEVVFRKFAQSSASVVLAASPGPLAPLDSHWIKLEGQPVFARTIAPLN